MHPEGSKQSVGTRNVQNIGPCPLFPAMLAGWYTNVYSASATLKGHPYPEMILPKPIKLSFGQAYANNSLQISHIALENLALRNWFHKPLFIWVVLLISMPQVMIYKILKITQYTFRLLGVKKVSLFVAFRSGLLFALSPTYGLTSVCLKNISKFRKWNKIMCTLKLHM